jgi:hypothetical protein
LVGPEFNAVKFLLILHIWSTTNVVVQSVKAKNIPITIRNFLAMEMLFKVLSIPSLTVVLATTRFGIIT